jgi:hypothetical protein
MSLDSLREVRRAQARRVANASRGGRERELELYRRIHLLVIRAEAELKTDAELDADELAIFQAELERDHADDGMPF